MRTSNPTPLKEETEQTTKTNIDNLLMLESTLEATDNGILVVSEEGKILHSNHRFVQMWDIPESLLNNFDDNIQLEYVSKQLVNPSAFLKNIRNLYASSQAEAFDVLIFKDGRIFERATSPMLLNGKPAGRVWSFRDITERKQSEEALHENKERLSLALQVSNAGIWEWNKTTDKVHFDDQFHAILGYSPGELPTNLQEWLTYHHPDDLPIMLARVDAYINGQNPIYESEHRIRTKSGEWAWVFTRGQNTSFANRTTEELFIGMAMNTTQHKKIEEELAQYRDHLEDQVERRTAELVEINQELEAFSYSVSHDLRAPLRSINGYSQVILEDYYDAFDDAGKNI